MQTPGKPQRHRGHREDTDMFFSVTTTKSQRHQDITKPARPPHTQRRDAKTQRRRGADAGFSARRGPGRRTTAGYRKAGPPIRMQAFVTVSRPCGLRSASAGLATSLPHSIPVRGSLHPTEEEERQNRRAKGTSAGEQRGGDERLGSEPASFSPATGDSQSPVVLP
jgi:hypothetical protein